MNRYVLLVLLLSLAAATALLYWGYLNPGRSGGGGGAPEMTYSRFLRELHADQVEEMHIRGRIVAGRGKDGKSFRLTLPYLDPQLADDMAEHAEVTFEEERPEWANPLLLLFPTVIVLAFLAGQTRGRPTSH